MAQKRAPARSTAAFNGFVSCAKEKVCDLHSSNPELFEYPVIVDKNKHSSWKASISAKVPGIFDEKRRTETPVAPEYFQLVEFVELKMNRKMEVEYYIQDASKLDARARQTLESIGKKLEDETGIAVIVLPRDYEKLTRRR